MAKAPEATLELVRVVLPTAGAGGRALFFGTSCLRPIRLLPKFNITRRYVLASVERPELAKSKCLAPSLREWSKRLMPGTFSRAQVHHGTVGEH